MWSQDESIHSIICASSVVLRLSWDNPKSGRKVVGVTNFHLEATLWNPTALCVDVLFRSFGKLVTTWISLGIFQHGFLGLELTCSSCIIWPMNYLNYWSRLIIHMLFGDCQNYFVHHYIPLSQYEYSSVINVIKICASGFAMRTETYIAGVVTMGTVSTC